MLELFANHDVLNQSVKIPYDSEKVKEYLKLVLEAYGLNFDGMTNKEFLDNLPLFFIRPLDELEAEVVFITIDHRLIHNFFFDLVSTGLIEKKNLPILSSWSSRFYAEKESYLLMVAKIQFGSQLEINLTLENLPEYIHRVKLSAYSINSQALSAECFQFAREVKKGIIVEKFLQFCERFKSGSRFDAWTFSHNRINELDFILNYIPDYAYRIIVALFHQYIFFAAATEKSSPLAKVKLIKIKNEYHSDIHNKLVCILSLNLRNKFEIFDLDTFVKFLHEGQKKLWIGKIQEVSFKDLPESQIKTFYIEFRISLDHVFEVPSLRKIKDFVSSTALQSIKQMTLPLFKPINEEEVLKDFVMLSQQLTHPSDIPQVIVHFDHHNLNELFFRVILIRVKLKDQIDLADTLLGMKESYDITIERVKTIGFIKKKLAKEACVISYRLKTHEFVREDHTIDFQQARYQVMQNLMKIFGPIRDFEGGMIAKHAEAFKDFQETVLEKTHVKLITLENFFYGIYPAEYRSLIPQEYILEMFFWWKKEKDKKVKDGEDLLIIFKKFSSEGQARSLIEIFQEKSFKIHEGFWVKFNHEGFFYLGVYVREKLLKSFVQSHF